MASFSLIVDFVLHSDSLHQVDVANHHEIALIPIEFDLCSGGLEPAEFKKGQAQGLPP